MGFKLLTLELAFHNKTEVHDTSVDASCKVSKVITQSGEVRYLLRYSDGIVLPIVWDQDFQGMTKRAWELKQRSYR
jgi:hypothetical protein